MDREQALDFLSQHHRAVLLTHRGDGAPQLSPVMVVPDGDGRALVSSRETAMKVRNLARDPRASLCVFTDRFFGPWVRIDGTAELVHLPEALELLVDYYRRAAGEHDDWDAYRQAMRDERRVLVRVHVDQVGPDVSG